MSEIEAVAGAEPHTLMRVPIRMASAVSAVLTGEAVAVPKVMTDQMRDAYDVLCWDKERRRFDAMALPAVLAVVFAASPWAPKDAAP